MLVAVRATIDAVTMPPSSSTSYASAWAVADRLPLTVVETATEPPPSTIPSGVRDGTLRDVPSSPDARSGATRPSVPETPPPSPRPSAALGAGRGHEHPRRGREHGKRCEESDGT